jgi:nucleoside-diphosphate-sugar epimerase
VRSLRYPGLVGYRSPPGGGTTDYAVDIYHKAIMHEPFSCYLKHDTPLPMIYTDDAVDATLQLMAAPTQNITIRTSYNIHSMTFTPQQIATEIAKVIPDFRISYDINILKQKIA